MKIISGRAVDSYLMRRNLASGASAAVERDVRKTIRIVKKRGDVALKELAKKYGDEPPVRFEMDSPRIRRLADYVDKAEKQVIDRAVRNIRAFADATVAGIRGFEIKHRGFRISLAYRPVQRAGCYVPGGMYPLPSSALMTVIPAKAAGVREISVASPSLAPEIVYAAKIAGADVFYRMGGAQAIAAFAFGTKNVERVDVIVGPGNAYVAEAKRQLAGVVGIDMIAGPSEVAIIADEGANPDKVAIDILAQLEHDARASAWILTNSIELARNASSRINLLAKDLGLPVYISKSLRNSAILLFDNLESAISVSNQIAPEHLQLAVQNPKKYVNMLSNYGTLFCGYDAAVPFGDYFAGPNHTLPTGGTARFSGALTPFAFLRPQNRLDVHNASALVRDTAAFAKMEGLKAHAASAYLRGK
jgi:histidinol dehydrogenase